MDRLEHLERTRDGDRFDELLDELLPDDETARATAVELLARLPSVSYRHIAVIAKCLYGKIAKHDWRKFAHNLSRAIIPVCDPYVGCTVAA